MHPECTASRTSDDDGLGRLHWPWPSGGGCSLLKPPHALRADPASKLDQPHEQTLSVWMPREASFDHFLAFLERSYGMALDVVDCLGAKEDHEAGKPRAHISMTHLAAQRILPRPQLRRLGLFGDQRLTCRGSKAGHR